MSFHDGPMTSNGAARLEGMKVQDPSTPTRKPVSQNLGFKKEKSPIIMFFLNVWIIKKLLNLFDWLANSFQETVTS